MDILRVNIKTLKFFLLWPSDNISWVTNIILSIIHQFITFIGSLPTFMAVGYQIAVGIDDINVTIESIIAAGDYVGFIFVYICFRAKVPKIKRTIQKSIAFLEYCDEDVIEEAEGRVRFYTLALMIYFIFGLTINGSLPLLYYDHCNKRRSSEYVKLHDPCGLPSRVWIPIEINTPARLYVAIFLFNFACVQISYTVLSVTMVLVGLLIHVTAQIKNLRIRLFDVFNTQGVETNSEELVKDMEGKLKFCIKYHNTIIEYTKEVFEAFNITLMVHVCLTSIILAIIGYQILSVDHLVDKSRYFLHLMGWVGMLFITCFYGQIILDESTTIADAAYQSEWYTGPVHLRKMICLIILRSQIPLLLRVASIGIVSLQTFVSVIKTAYSYFALLLTIAE